MYRLLLPDPMPGQGSMQRSKSNADDRAEHKTAKMSTEVTGMRGVAVVGWLGIVGVLLVWQGIGLVRGPEWPTLSDFFRSFMTVPFGRFLVFGLWLWLGWHLFIRGWAFFLRS
jgi:hypothetical protein